MILVVKRFLIIKNLSDTSFPFSTRCTTIVLQSYNLVVRYDHTYDLENGVIQEENDYETGEPGNNQRPFTSDQTVTGKRPKVKTNNFYGFQSMDKLPIVHPQIRPYSDKGIKISGGRSIGQNSSFKSQDKSSYLITKDLEYDQPSKIVSSPKRFLAVTSSGPQKNTKLIPKNIPQDKERLYDENLSLKNILHALRDENLRLKTKVNVYAQEAVRYEKIMADQEGGIVEREFIPKPNESHLLVGLKNKLIEVENTLQEKETELSKVKKSIKVTKISEMEVQLKMFTEESYRLKGILDQLLREKTQNLSKNDNKIKLQEEIIVQAAQIKALEKDHEQLVKIIKSLEHQGADQEKKHAESEKKKKSEIKKLKKLVAEKEKENVQLKQEVETAYSHMPKTSHGIKRPTVSGKEDMLLHELEKKKAENSSLVDQLTEKNNQIQHLEKMLRNSKSEKPGSLQSVDRVNNRKPSERFSKPLLLNVTNANETGPAVETKPVVKEVKEEKREHPTPNAAEFENENPQEVQEESSSAELEDEMESERLNSVPRRRVQKVRAEDVKELGYRINLSLRANGITFEDLNKDVWPEGIVETGRLNIREAIDILRSEPFALREEEDAIMIARYLIEDNQEDYLFYDEEIEGELVIVKSILKKLIGPIPNWNKETAKKLHDSVSEICTKYHLSLRENLRVTCKDGNLNKKALQEVCKIIEVTMSDDQLEFIITKLYEKSNDVQALAIESLFEIFYKQPTQETLVQEKPRQNTPQETAPVSQKLTLETKQNNDFTIFDNKSNQKSNELLLKSKTPQQETIHKEEVNGYKSKTPQGLEMPKAKETYEAPKVVKEEINIKRPSETKKEEPIVLHQEIESEEEQYENEGNGEEEYKFEEEEHHEKHKVENKTNGFLKAQNHEEENKGLTPSLSNRESERAESMEVPESTRRIESQATNHTNTTQFSEPKSEVYGLPGRNQNQEDRKEHEIENLNPISERDETEIRKDTHENKATKEQNESDNEYQDDAEEEIEEENYEEEGEEKEKLPVKKSQTAKAEKGESGDEEYDDDDMGFEEEIEDDS